LCSYV